MDTKICKRCKEEFDIYKFSKSKNNKGGYNTKCMKCVYQAYYKDKDDVKKYREKLYQIKYYYGLNKEDYESLVKNCNNSCSICKKNAKDLSTGLVVDHCHETNKIRGLLCQDCNRGLGMYKENVEYMKNAIVYLDHHNNTT